MLRTLFICASVLLFAGCDKSDESLYDLAGDWERITDAECVGDLEQDFLAGNRFTIFSDPKAPAPCGDNGFPELIRDTEAHPGPAPGDLPSQATRHPSLRKSALG